MSSNANKRQTPDSLQNMAAPKKSKKTSIRQRSHPLQIVPVPVPRGSDHPPPPYGNGLLPVHEFTVSLFLILDGINRYSYCNI